jgi:hypothetical protein
MENAHLRMGLLEYERHREKIAARIRVRVSHYIEEDEDAHLLSVFGNDSDIGAITAPSTKKRDSGSRSPAERRRKSRLATERSVIAAASAFPVENRPYGT